MSNIQIVLDADGNEHIVQEFAPNEFRATPKQIWDAQQEAQSL